MRIRLPQTRIGELLPSWDGAAITLADDCPTVDALYQQALAHCDDSTPDDSPLSSLLSSPLSTPPSSRPASPLQQAHEPADHSHNDSLQPVSRHGRKRRRKGYSKVARKRRRDEGEPTAGPSAAACVKYIAPSVSRAVHVKYDTSQAKTTVTAFTAARSPPTQGHDYSLADLTGPDAPRPFRVYEWDGRTTVPIVDSAGRVVAVLAGQPDDPAWRQVHENAASALEEARLQLNAHRRKKRRGSKSHR
ncbi:hypothetical protein FISHEDRAFT_75158 [Fistulina hepatica ATCC 64428]|uniref:Uncharacterized protein n=1 Tax=Fistulina hepatica ATCC 64428 TaxID=1128425 RepID=A0A0D7A863_9AGAR|nr:hypothetical protein FISHEDRAFT_75158 [Fistulina hepatica ATCC 64428]